MATRIEMTYDRQFTDADISAIVARATVTINVLQQLEAEYQSLPGYAMPGYQTETDALEKDVQALRGHIDAILPLLRSIDAKAGPLDAKNKNLLRTLRGLLTGKPQLSFLEQITGPTPQGGSNMPTPTPPPSP
jgi:hypothetical protein